MRRKYSMASANTLITVVVPVYQVEQYLMRCIDSIRNQTYKNLEIILVDDGSKDKSPSICDEYVEKDTRIQVIHKENGGLSSARNAGIEQATGEYIIFIDSDDMIHPKMIEELYNLLQDTNSDIAICGYRRFSEQEELEKIVQPDLARHTYSREEALCQIYGLESIKYVVAWNKLYSIKLFDGVRYKLGKLNEDEFTTYKLFAKSSRIVSTNQIYYYYFYNGNSITTNQKYLASNDIYEAYSEAIAFFKENGYYKAASIAEKSHLYRLISRCRTYYNMGKEKDEEFKTFRRKYKQYYKLYCKDFRSIGLFIFLISYKGYFMFHHIKDIVKNTVLKH